MQDTSFACIAYIEAPTTTACRKPLNELKSFYLYTLNTAKNSTPPCRKVKTVANSDLLAARQSAYFKWRKKMSRYCNEIKLDPCLTEAPLCQDYYMPDPFDPSFFRVQWWSDEAGDYYYLKHGFAYDSPEAAAKHGEAMTIVREA